MAKFKRGLALFLAIVMVISMMNLTVFAEDGDQTPVVNVDGLGITEESVLICGLEESEGHTHDESCYTTEQVLTCGIPENHVHTVDCYQLGDPDFGKGTGMEIDGQWYLVDHIICEIPVGHVHTDECYETREVLTCGLEESEGHTHTDACYAAVKAEVTEPVEVESEITEPVETEPQATEPAETGPQVTEAAEHEPEVAETVAPEIVEPTEEPAPVEPETIEELPQGDEPWGLAYGDGGYGSGGSRASNDGWDRAYDAYFFIMKPDLGDFPTDGRYDGWNSWNRWESAGRGRITVDGGIEPENNGTQYGSGRSVVNVAPNLDNTTIEVGGITYTYGIESSPHYYTVEWKYAIGAKTSDLLDNCVPNNLGWHWHMDGYAILSDAPTTNTGSLVIEKKINATGKGSDPDDFNDTIFRFSITGPYGNKIVQIKGAGKEVIGDLQPGEYTVTELDPIDAPVNYMPQGTTYTSERETGTNEITVTVEAGKDAPTVTVTNRYKSNTNTGSLTIAKAVIGGGEEAASKIYTFDVAGPNGYTKTATVTGANSTTLTGLTPGAYTVNERDANIEGYKLDTTVGGNATVTVGGTATVTVTNTYTELGSLTIHKTVDGGPDDATTSKVYTFTVEGPDGYKNETVTITGNGSIALENLVPGDYTVTEQNADIPGYNLEVTGGGAVTVETGETTEVTVTNKYTPKPGSLKITKMVDDGPDDATTSKVYTFTVTGPSYPEGQEKTITITGNGSETLGNLAPGTYTVTEVEDAANIEGYSLEITGEGNVTVEADTEASATVTNKYTELPKLEITKIADKTNVQSGDTVTFTITVKNTGNVPAHNVVVTDALPADLTYGASSPSGSPDPHGNVTFNLGTLEANGTRNIKVVATVDKGATGILINSAKVTCKEEVSAQDSAEVTVVDPDTPTKNVSVTITKMVIGEGAPEDDEFTFHYDAYTVDTNGKVNIANGDFTLKNGGEKTIENLAEGYPITITETPKDGYRQPESKKKVVHDGETITITNYYLNSKPELNISKTASKSTVNPGEAVDFTITVTNTGTGTAHNVVINDVLPDNFSQLGGKDTFDWDLGNLLPGESKTVTLRQVYVSETDSNTATATCDENKNGVQASARVVVNDPTVETYTLTVHKVVEDTNAPADDEFHFRVNVNNGQQVHFETIKAGNEFVFNGLKDGDTITVEEVAIPEGYDAILDQQDGWTLDKTVYSTTVNGNVSLTVTNKYDPEKVPGTGEPTDPADPEYTYTLTYDPNGGEFWFDSSVVKSYTGTAFTHTFTIDSGITPTLEGYNFVGWATEKGSKTPVKEVTATVMSRDKVVYAIWEKKVPVLEISKTASKTIYAGQILQYTILVTNKGDADANKVVVTDKLPEGVSYFMSSSNAAFANGTVTAEIGTLAADNSAVVNIWVTVDKDATDDITNTATADSDETEPVEGAATTTVTQTTPETEPKPQISDTEVTVKKEVVNLGSAKAPANDEFTFTYVAKKVNTEGKLVDISGTFALKAGGEAKLSVAKGYPITITEDQKDGYQILDPVKKVVDEDNKVITIVNHYMAPELNINKTASKSTVNPGEAVDFTITVTNTGTATAHNVVITDCLPEGFSQLFGKTKFEWKVGNLKPGESETVTLSQVYASKTGSNTATAMCDEIPNGVNASARVVVNDPTVKTYTLTVKKVVEGEGAPADDEFHFRVIVNGGNPHFETIKVDEQFKLEGLKKGDEVTVEELVDVMPDGYTVKGDNSQTVTIDNENETITVTNEYKKPDEPEKPTDPEYTYTLTYNPNCNSDVENMPENQVEKATALTFPFDVTGTPTRKGYAFRGWSLTEDGKTPVTSVTANVMSPDKEVYAIWEQLFYSFQVLKVDADDHTRTLAGAEFTLTDESGNAIASATSGGDGVATFEHIPMGEYTLTETKAPDHYTATETEYKLTINGEGSLNGLPGGGNGDVNGAGQLVIENKWTPDPVTVALTGNKTVNIEGNGNPSPDAEFTFVLSKDGTVIDSQSLTIAAIMQYKQQSFTFKSLTFSEIGSYTYTVTETKGNAAGWEYDARTCTVTVDVIRVGDELKAEVSYGGDNGITFTNTYKPASVTQTAGFQVVKMLTGPVPSSAANSFQFVLSGDNQVNEQISVDYAAGEIGEKTASFEPLTFDHAGTYTFKISEVKGSQPGFSYDSTTTDVTVEVKDNNGQLEIASTTYTNSANGETDAAEFTNTYNPKELTFTPTINKVIEGEVPSTDSTFNFKMELKSATTQNGVVMGSDEASVEGAGSASFGTMTIVSPGIYTFEITEIEGNDTHYTYDNKTITLTLVVGIEGNSLFIQNQAYTNNATFTNTYDSEDVTFTPRVSKAVVGDAPKDETFSFAIAEAEGNPTGGAQIPENAVTVTGAGTAEFSEITFTKAGNYNFSITEDKGTAPGWAYDESTWNLNVVVEDKDGKLVVTSHSYNKDGETADSAQFTNTYSVTNTDYSPKAINHIDTNDFEPVTIPGFQFTIEAADERAPMPVNSTVTVNDEGDVDFGAITFTKTGTYTYTIKETAGSEAGWTYDTGEWTLTVTVEDVDSQLTVTSANYTKDGMARIRAISSGTNETAGVAEFTNTYIEHYVTYRFEGDAPAGADLPGDSHYVEGASVTVANGYDDIVVNNGDGTTTTYHFEGWDSDSFPMPNHDVEITGTWTSDSQDPSDQPSDEPSDDPSDEPTNEPAPAPVEPEPAPADPVTPPDEPEVDIPDDNPPLSENPEDPNDNPNEPPVDIPDENPPLTDDPTTDDPADQNEPADDPTVDIPDENPPLAEDPTANDPTDQNTPAEDPSTDNPADQNEPEDDPTVDIPDENPPLAEDPTANDPADQNTPAEDSNNDNPADQNEPEDDPTVDIPDENPPLGEDPGTAMLPDEQVPMDGAPPQTGDTSIASFWMVLFVVSALGLVALFFEDKRKVN